MADFTTRYLDTLRACLFAVVIWGGPALVAWWIASRLQRQERLHVRVISACVLHISFVVLTGELLGTMGILIPECAIVIWLSIVVLECLLNRTHSLKRQTTAIEAHNCANDSPARTLLHFCRARIADGFWIVVPIIAIIITQAVLRGLRYPPLAWDSLTYHYFLPARWIQLGEIAPFAAPGGMDTYRAAPINMELVVAWAMLPFRSDAFVNLINFPLFGMAALAAYGILRELRVTPKYATASAIILVFAPPLWCLVTTQYGEAYVAATLLVGLFFLIRLVRTHAMTDLFACAAAMGLAAGGRYSVLPYVAVVPATAATMLLIKRVSIRRTARMTLIATSIGVICGGYQYIRNWIELSNPVYPMEVKLAGVTLFEESHASHEALTHMPTPSREKDLRHVRRVFSPAYRTWGPVFAIVVLLAVGTLLSPRKFDAGILILWLVVAVNLITFYGPMSGHAANIRTEWPGSSQRFLAPAMMSALLLAAIQFHRSRLPSIWPVGMTAAALICFRIYNPATPAISIRTNLFIAIASLIAVWTMRRWRQPLTLHTLLRRSFTTPLAMAVLLLIPLAVQWLMAKREELRPLAYQSGSDYYRIPRDCVPIWRALDEKDESHVVALSRKRKADGDESYVTHSTTWFMSPLLGGRLQNKVCYSSIFELGDIPSPRYRGGLSDDWSELVWLRNLGRLEVDRIVLQKGTVPEGDWIQRRPDLFEPILTTETHALYRVRVESLNPAIAAASVTPEADLSLKGLAGADRGATE